MKKINTPLMIYKFKLIYSFLVCGLFSQNFDKNASRHIDFPNINGFITMVCDFHTHSVFSDGSVWPDIRIQEAQKDGLDAIAITEHLEYQPHKNDIPHPDRNRSYELAKKFSKGNNILVINGSEITKQMPPGHSNAIFISDANKILNEDYLESFKEANNQKAFVFWNHPYWVGQSSNGLINLSEKNINLIKKKMVHGIEVTNDLTYSDEAIQLALDYNLTFIGTSDIHGLVDWQYKIDKGGHRPVTLVFSKKRSLTELKEALFERRTVVWYNNLLIGLDKWVKPLILKSLQIKKFGYYRDTEIAVVVLENTSDARFILQNLGDYTFYRNSDIIEIQPNSDLYLGVKTKKKLQKFDLTFSILNAVIGPKKHPKITLQIKGADKKKINDVVF